MSLNLNGWSMFNQQEWSTDYINQYAAFVYLIEFSNSGEYYIGVKQVYKGLKNIRDLKSNSTESNWITYISSSKTVKEYIADGEPYTKKVLYCFNSVQEAMQVESALICIFGSEENCLNKALMVKTRLQKNSNTKKIIQELIEYLV